MQKKGFTLVELVIVIVIVGILSIVAVPIYKGYVEKAKMTEGKALASAVRNAQMVYYAEHGEYYTVPGYKDYDTVLGIDARGNKYYKHFYSAIGGSFANTWFAVADASGGANTNTLGLLFEIDPEQQITVEGRNLPVFYTLIDGVREFI